MKAALVFAAMFAMDFVWARYTAALAEYRALAGSTWAVLIILLSGYVTVQYVNDAAMLVPAALGAFGGTFAAIKLARRRSG